MAMTKKKGKNKQKKTSRGNEKRKNKVHYIFSDDPVRDAVEADGSKTVVDMCSDGNCLFRSLSDQLYADYGSNHDEVRREICDYLEAHEDEFKIFLVLDEEDEDATDFDSYVQSMREDGEWGGNLELVAAARLYGRNIIVFSAELSAFTIPHDATNKPDGPDMLVSYHDNDHYNSVRDCSIDRPLPVAKEYEYGNGMNGEGKEQEQVEIDDMPEQPKEQPNNKRPPKKSAPCPCGSGLRYKRCCWQRERHAARIKERMDLASEQEEEIATMEGGFRVLRI